MYVIVSGRGELTVLGEAWETKLMCPLPSEDDNPGFKWGQHVQRPCGRDAGPGAGACQGQGAQDPRDPVRARYEELSVLTGTHQKPVKLAYCVEGVFVS